MSSDDSAELQTQLDSIVGHFVHSWETDPESQAFVGNIESVLPAFGRPLRRTALTRLIELDLANRWSRGERPTLDRYQERFLELGAVAAWPAKLLLAELEQHKLHGPESPLSVVMSRFPERLAELSKLAPELLISPQPSLPAQPPAQPLAQPPAQPAAQPPAQPPMRGTLVPDFSAEPIALAPEVNETASSRDSARESFSGSTSAAEKPTVPEPIVPEPIVPEPTVPAPTVPAPTVPAPMNAVPSVSTPAAASSFAADAPRQILQLTPDRLRANLGPGYHVIRKIGEGNYGEVWLAEAPGGIEVALKCIRFPIGHEINDREFRGLQLMKNMRHPFLLQVQAFWAVDNQLVIAMELADGSLGQLLEKQRRQSLPRKELLRYFGEAAEGIDYLHQHNVVHRDIKPDNILLLKGHAKVADFGLARFIDETGLSTAATQLAGSPAYMAPEVWTQKWQPASDQYSLAITYFELRTGHLPFQSNNPYEAMQDHLHHAPDLNDLPKDERRIIKKALAKNPVKRFRNCAALVDALAQSEPTVAARHTHPKSTSQVLWLLLPTLVALLAVVIAVPLLLIRQPEKQAAWLPPESNFAAASTAPLVHIDGRWLHERITEQLPSGQLLTFILVKVAPSADLRSFYMLETEVPNFAFAQFAAEHPELIAPESQQWQEGALAGEELLGVDDAQANLPVVSISRDTSLACAQWLGGTLPSIQQWDAAAGIGRADWHDPGPYKSAIVSDEEYAASQPARIRRGPAAVGTSPDDESPLGIRDMAGNVDEWTNDFTNPSVALQCWIRGNSYDEQTRWRFDDIPRSRPRNEARESTGFRVVLRIPTL